MDKINTIDAYIAQYSLEEQERMQEIRRIILEIEPSLQEKMSWGMPTFWQKKNIIHFAMHKKHIGIYPGPEAIVYFEEELKEYQCSKGAIQLPHDKKIPKTLIEKIVKYNINN